MIFFDSKECEWSDQDVFLNGVKIGKIRGLKFKASKEKDPLHAGGDKPISLQGGNRTYEGTLTILKGALEDINRACVAEGGKDCLDAEFVVVCTYKARTARALQTHTLSGLQFSEFELGMMQNDKFTEVGVPFKFLDLIST